MARSCGSIRSRSCRATSASSEAYVGVGDAPDGYRAEAWFFGVLLVEEGRGELLG